MNARYVIFCILSFLLSLAGSLLICHYGHRLGLLDKPNVRSSHQAATPKGGGIGILIAFVFVSLSLSIPISFWLPATILSIISLFGDHIDLSPVFRLFFQFSASLIFLVGFWKGHPDHSAGYILMFPFAIYMVGTANYYNFMDGINGIAGISGIVGFAFLSIYGYLTGASEILITLSAAVSLSCLGFLPLNFPKARVFMGDVGSILLGFIFAALAIQLATGVSDFVCLLLFLFPFYADEITTELVRLKDGEKLWVAHRRHLYQIFANELGISHWKVSLTYGLIQIFVGLSSLYMVNKKVGPVAVCALLFLYLFIFYSVSSLVRRKVSSQ